MDLNKAEVLALELMSKHDLLKGIRRWKFTWGTSRTQFGRVDLRRRTIILSSLYVSINSKARVRETILHEIAHAIAGYGHGPTWKEAAKRVGCEPKACFTDKSTVIPYKYKTVCRVHGRVGQANTRWQMSCSRCSPKFNSRFLLSFEPIKN